MFKNYILSAWRHIFKNGIYSVINIFGLMTGLSVFFFGTLLTNYELSHDLFFKNASRIYTVGSVFSPHANVGIIATDAAHTALTPIIRAEIPELASIARIVKKEFLLSVDNKDFYERIRFADKELLDIFDFSYLEGSAQAIDDPNGILLTKSMAVKYFGGENALGKSIILDHGKVLKVTAVIEDLPPNTHFNSSIVLDSPLGMIASLSILNTEKNNAEDGNWNNLSIGDMTYLLAPNSLSKKSLQEKFDAIFKNHNLAEKNDFVGGYKINSLVEANTFIWSAIGMPVIESIQILAFFVLLVAIVNYTNLATAQSMGRSREVGLRKTMGASRNQLLVQFLVESVIIALISMIFSLAILEISVPIFNTALDKGLIINYSQTLPWLISTAIIVGLIAGAYPAYLITQTDPIKALRGSDEKGTTGNFFRSVMQGVQFAISIFILSIVLVVYFQNAKLEQSGDIFPRSQIVNLNRLDIPEIQSQLDTLTNEIRNIEGITGVTYSSQVPFQQSNSSFGVSTVKGDDTNTISVNQVVIDPYFLEVYNIPILSGRNLSNELSGDLWKQERESINVIVNQLFFDKLGFSNDTIDPVFYDFDQKDSNHNYHIVGVIPNQNFLGFHNAIKPMLFVMDPDDFSIASLRIEGRNIKETMAEVEDTWRKVIPNYPIQVKFLNEIFGDVFKIFDTMTKTLAGFASLAIALSLVGLFGLAAFMVEKRTKEIGIRKVMGANHRQIVRLLIWQLSRPVMWSSLIALPAAYFASSTYLNFFADRLSFSAVIIVVAGLVAFSFACLIIAMHAVKIARANPIHALRYE